MTSSNDAAAVFEESFESPEAFLALMRAKVEKIGMANAIITEASGVSGANRASAADLLKLIEYITATHPDILASSRIAEFTVQPLNGLEPRTIRNINPFVTEATFLGGKTGTSPESKENLLALFSRHGRRIAVVILGSTNRMNDTRAVLAWLDRAYEW
jgi:D-alanyl-D-alanine carboxypeptidase